MDNTIRSARLTAALLTAALLMGLGGLGTAALAQTTVKEPWIRATVPQQTATGAFMQIQSTKGGRLVSAASPAAGMVEIHEMVMDGTTMKMRALANGLDLPPGKSVALKPGGYHVMMMDLKTPLKAGDVVPLTLLVVGKDGQRESIELKAPVKAMTDGAH
jgi:periplasmic copper chaperone A